MAEDRPLQLANLSTGEVIALLNDELVTNHPASVAGISVSTIAFFLCLLSRNILPAE